MEKLFIESNQLLRDSFKIALNVYESGFRPNYIVGVWRGGAPIGIAVQELLDIMGVKSDHFWKSTGRRFAKINERMIRIANRLKELSQ